MVDDNPIQEYNGILIDYNRDRIIPEQGLALLTGKGFYKKDGEDSPQQGFARAATCYSFGDYEFAQRIYNYFSKGMATFASPVLSNAVNVEWPSFGEDEFEEAGDWLVENVTPEGMPISCFEGSAPVLTSNGTKSIRDIKVGDLVLTHKGRFKEVVATRESVSSDIYELQVYTNEAKVKVTGNHRMLTDFGWVRVDELDEGKHFIANAHIKEDTGDCLRYSSIEVLRKLEPVETTVYDIQVKDDESFSVGGMIAHNCFLNKIGDSKESLVKNRQETAWLSMQGGGVGIMAANRSPDEKSTGVMSHLRGYDADTISYRQTASRRGSMAAYLDIDHPEILSFIDMRNPVGGDQNKKCFNLNNGVNIPDSFMEAVIKGDKYELVDPKHGKTGRFLDARSVWEKILETRYETGEPYILFKDTVNRNIPGWIMRPLYTVYQSNLCTEITLMTSDKRTAVCCLSSLNLAMWPEIQKEPQIIEDLVRFLDNVLEYFIRLAPPELSRAVRSAYKERAIGLGTLGFHSLLQRKNIPFESGGVNSASSLSYTIYKEIQDRAKAASMELGTVRGESPDCRGSGMRNSHLIAIAPNASSSSMVGPARDTTNSPSIEPYASNCYNAQGRAGSFLIKNFHLGRVLASYGMDTEEVWKSIEVNGGSVQHLEFLTDHEKKVFKTSTEIDPMWIIELASIRQPFICQSQSVNIFVHKDITKQEMSDIHMKAWEKGLKSLYYCRAEKASQIQIGTGGDKPLNSVPVRAKIEYDECLSCQG